jgi:hypothetical protein
VSFFIVFNGVTLATFLYIVFCTAVYTYGQRWKVAVDDPELRRRFKTRVLNVSIWGLFLVYPQARARERYARHEEGRGGRERAHRTPARAQRLCHS